MQILTAHARDDAGRLDMALHRAAAGERNGINRVAQAATRTVEQLATRHPTLTPQKRAEREEAVEIMSNSPPGQVPAKVARVPLHADTVDVDSFNESVRDAARQLRAHGRHEEAAALAVGASDLVA
eukprot:COSAG04_NODE_8008_length_1035_cov_1.545940_2_plen_125_part_01